MHIDALAKIQNFANADALAKIEQLGIVTSLQRFTNWTQGNLCKDSKIGRSDALAKIQNIGIVRPN